MQIITINGPLVAVLTSLEGCHLARDIMKYVKFDGLVTLAEHPEATTELFKRMIRNYELTRVLEEVLESKDKRTESALEKFQGLDNTKFHKKQALYHLDRIYSRNEQLLLSEEYKALRVLIEMTRSSSFFAGNSFANEFVKLFIKGPHKVLCKSINETSFGVVTSDLKKVMSCGK